MYDEDSYQSQITVLHESKFRASLLWLVSHDAITLTQADRLQEIQGHRHELTHELVKCVIDVKFEPSSERFVDALAILEDISRFWTQIEIDIDTFQEYGDISVDEPVPMSLYVLQICVDDAYGQGLSDLDVDSPTEAD